MAPLEISLSPSERQQFRLHHFSFQKMKCFQFEFVMTWRWGIFFSDWALWLCWSYRSTQKSGETAQGKKPWWLSCFSKNSDSIQFHSATILISYEAGIVLSLMLYTIEEFSGARRSKEKVMPWKKLDASEFGIQRSMIPESTRMVLNKLRNKGSLLLVKV